MSISRLFTKIVGSTNITFKNTESLSISKIVFFKETGLTGNWLSKQYRYSYDNIIWTSWNTLTQNALANIGFNDRPIFWLEIIYTRENYTTADIDDFYLFYDGATTVADTSTLIDADLLNGHAGIYYLDSTNAYGPVPNVHVENLPLRDTSTGGIYAYRTDGTLYSTFYFKSIGGTGGITVTDASDAGGNNMLMISVNASVGGGANIGDGDASIYSHLDTGILQMRELKGSSTIDISPSDNIVIIDSSGLSTIQYVDSSISAAVGAVDSSLVTYVNTYNIIQDTSSYKVTNRLDASITRIDASISTFVPAIGGSFTGPVGFGTAKTAGYAFDVSGNVKFDNGIIYLDNTQDNAERYTISNDRDRVTAGTNSLFITPLTNQSRLYFGAAGQVFEWLDMEYVTTLRNAPNLVFTSAGKYISWVTNYTAITVGNGGGGTPPTTRTNLMDFKVWDSGSGGGFSFYGSNTSRPFLFIDGRVGYGNVGIGKVNPNILYKLDVSGNINIDGSIYQDGSLINYFPTIARLNSYNVIQDTSLYKVSNRLDASIARLDAYNLIQDASIAAFETNDVTFAYVDGSIASAVDAVDSSLVTYVNTYVDAYNNIQDTSSYEVTNRVDASIARIDASLQAIPLSVSQAYVDGSISVAVNTVDSSLVTYVDAYNNIQDTSSYEVTNRLDASIARIDASLQAIPLSVSQAYVDGSISAAVDAVDSSLVTYVNAYNNIQDTSSYEVTNRVDASIARIDAYQLIQDASIAAFEANDVTTDYVDGSISAAVDAVDSSLVTYVDAYNIIQDTSVLLRTTAAYVDGSLATRDTAIGLRALISDVNAYNIIQDTSFLLRTTAAYVDGSLATRDTAIGLRALTSDVNAYNNIQDTSSYKVTNRLDASIARIDAYQLIQDASIAAFETNDVTFAYVDGSIAAAIDALDSSLVTYVDTYNIFQNTSILLRALITDVNEYNIIQDASIANLDASISSVGISQDYVDGSISAAINKVDASIARIDDYNNIQDTSILLRALSSTVDASISRIDAYNNIQDTSMLLRALTSTVNTYNTIQDTSSYKVTNRLDASIARLDAYNNIQDTSSYKVTNRLDASITRIDAYNNIQDTSSYKVTNRLDASIARLDAYNLIQDTSMLLRALTSDVNAYNIIQDTSSYKVTNRLDASIARLDAYNLIQDTSMLLRALTSDVDAYNNIQDTSSYKVTNRLDASIARLDAYNLIQDASIATFEANDVTFVYVDGSLVTRDIAINTKLDNTTDTFTGILTIDGSLILQGDFYLDGSAYTVSSTQIDVSVDFITLRVGAVAAIADGSISGIKVEKADGVTNVILGTGPDAIMRVGWEGDTLVALAAREDAPTDGWYAYWDDSSSMFKTYNLRGYIDSSLASRDASISVVFTKNNIQDSYNLIQDTSLYKVKNRLDASIVRLDAYNNIQDTSMLLRALTSTVNTYNTIQDTSSYKVTNRVDASIARIDAYNIIQDTSSYKVTNRLDASIARLDAYNLIQDASSYKVTNRLDASIARLDAYNLIQDASIAAFETNDVTFDYVDGSIATAVDAVDSSLVTYVDSEISSKVDAVDSSLVTYVDSEISSKVDAVDSSLVTYVDAYNNIQDTSILLRALTSTVNAYNTIQDTSLYKITNRLDASIARLDAYNLIQDASIAAFETNDVTFAYVDGSISTAINAVDSSLVTYIDAYNIIQDTSILLRALTSDVNTYNVIQDTSLYKVWNRLDASIARIDASLWQQTIPTDFYSQTYVDGSLATRDASIDVKVETASNIGTGDASVFSAKVGNDLQFKKLIGSGAAIVTDGVDTITISLDGEFAGEVNTASNLGTGSGLYAQKISDDLQFKSLKSTSTTVNLTSDSTHIYLDVSLGIQDASITTLKNYNLIQDTSVYKVWNRLDASIARIDASLQTISSISQSYIDGSISTAVTAVDSSLVTYVNAYNIKQDTSILLRALTSDVNTYNIIQDTSLYKVTNRLDASIARIDAYNIKQDTSILLRALTTTVNAYNTIQDTSSYEVTNRLDASIARIDASLQQIAGFEANDVTFAYVDGSIVTAISAVDSSLVTYVNAYNIIQDTSILLRALTSDVNAYNIIQDTSIYKVTNRLDASIARIDASLQQINVGDATKVYVDGSLSTRDASIAYNLSYINNLISETPALNEIAIFGGDGSIYGDSNLKFVGTDLSINGNVIVSGTLGNSSTLVNAIWLENAINFIDANAQIWKDGANNLTFKDTIGGTITLFELTTQGNAYNTIQDTSLYKVTNRLDASIARLDAYNIIQDTSFYKVTNRLDASIDRIDAYNNIQDTSLYKTKNQLDASIDRIDASLQAIPLSISQAYVDGSISAAINKVDASITRIDAYNTIQDTSLYKVSNRLDASIARIDAYNVIQDTSILLRALSSTVDAYNIKQDTSTYKQFNQINSSIARFDSYQIVNNDGKANTSYGFYAGNSITSGVFNTFMGYNAGTTITTGGSNTAIGGYAMFDAASGANNVTAIGLNTGSYVKGNALELIGQQAGLYATGTYSTVIGFQAGYYVTSNNIFIGKESGKWSIGGQNVFIGTAAGKGYDSSVSTGTYNTAIGYNAGIKIAAGGGNTYVGAHAGNDNSIGVYNVFLGYNSGGQEYGSNKLYIANSNTTTPLIYGEFPNTLVRITADLELMNTPTDPSHAATKDYVDNIDIVTSLGELIDISIGNELNNQVLAYDTDGSVYMNKTLLDSSLYSVIEATDLFHSQEYIDGSLARIDASLQQLGGGGIGDVTKVYVDGSLATRDASIDVKVETASNIGTGDASVFSAKVGNDLQFKKLVGSGAATVTDSTDTITIGLSGEFSGEVNTASNLGTGVGLYAQKVSDDLQFKSLKSTSTTVNLTSDATHVYLDVSLGDIDASIYQLANRLDASIARIDASLQQLGGGDVLLSGSPANTNIAYFSDATTITGGSTLVWSGGALQVNDTVKTNNINELSGTAGVTIEGNLLKDNLIYTNDLYLNNNSGIIHNARYIYWGDDGDWDTYFVEASDDILALYVGGQNKMQWNGQQINQSTIGALGAIDGFNVQHSGDTTDGAHINLVHYRTTGSTLNDNDLMGVISGWMYNDAGTPELTQSSKIIFKATDTTDGTEDAVMQFQNIVDGALSNTQLEIAGTSATLHSTVSLRFGDANVYIKRSGADLVFYDAATGEVALNTLSGGVAGVSKTYVDGSLATRDASITYLFSNPVEGVSQAYVDGSLATRDASLQTFFPYTGGTTLPLNTINEFSGGSGVTIEGVLIKDNDIIISGGEKLYLDTGVDTYIYEGATGVISLVADDNTFLSGSATYTKSHKHLLPVSNNTLDIGESSTPLWWKDVYAQRYYIDEAATYIYSNSGALTFVDAAGSATLATLIAGGGGGVTQSYVDDYNIIQDTSIIHRVDASIARIDASLNDTLAGEDLFYTQDYIDGSINSLRQGIVKIAAKTDNYTLVLTDAGKLITMYNAAAKTLYVPLHSSVPFPIGTSITVIATGAGQITIAAVNPATTLSSADGKLNLRVQFSSATLIKVEDDLWYVMGDITT